MNREQDAELGMFKNTDGFMDDHASEIGAFSGAILATYHTQLKGLLGQIQDTAGLTSVTTQGVTQTKAQARVLATLLVIDVRNILFNYSSDHIRPNPSLPASPDNPTDYAMQTLQKDMSQFTAGFLDNLKDEEVVIYFKTIQTKATGIATVTPPVLNPLIPYGLREDVDQLGDETYEPGALTQLETAINNYTTLTTSPRAAIAGRKTQNKVLKELYVQGHTLLEKMDNCFSSIKATNAELYDGYTNSRTIVLLTFATQITGTVSKLTDLQLGTTQVVEDAKITVLATPYLRTKNGQTTQVKPDPVIVQTDGEGTYSVPTPDTHTDYIVTCSLPGYGEDQIAPIKVRKGKKTQVDFLMLPVQAG